MALWVVLPAAASTRAAAWADSVVQAAEERYDAGDMPAAVDGLYTLVRKADADAGIPDSTAASACLLLANIYLTYSDFTSAVKYYKKGLDFTDNPNMRMSFVNNLAVTSCILGNEREARHYSAEIMKIRPDDKNRQKYNHVISRAFIEKAFGSRDKSVRHFKEAIGLVRENKMDSSYYYLTPLSELSEYYARHGDKATALYWLKRYEKAVDGTKNKAMIADARRLLLEVYIASGDRDRALEYCKLYVSTVDSLCDTQHFLNVTSRVERRAEEEDHSLIRNLEVTISKQKIIIMAIVAALLLGFAIWFALRRLRLDRNLLFARNRELALLETEKRASRFPAQESPAPAPSEPEAEKWAPLMKAIEEVVSDPVNFCNPDFSLSELAGAVNSNTKYVSQAINETTGDNFRAYVNGFRIREARSRLTTDINYAQLTIQSIGESVGFKSVSNFSIAFKKVTGMTPSLYKKMAGKHGKDE